MPIHPTAIVHPGAKIAASANIGPYVCIEGPADIADGCVMEAHSILAGKVTLGANTRVGYGAVIGAPAQHLAHGPDHAGEVIIGSGNTFREYCTIHRSTVEGKATRVGDNCFLMAGSHLGHDSVLGNHVVIANNALLGGHVELADRVFVGGATVFHQHMKVGRLAITQGKSGFSKDIPPFTVGAEVNTVAGINVIALRRAGFSSAERLEIKNAFKLLYKSGLNVSQALEAADGMEWGPNAREFFDFVRAAKKRGVCDLLQTHRGGQAAEGDD